MIIVHHLNESRSERILWLREELQAPYEVAFYRRDARTNLAPVELREVHPQVARDHRRRSGHR
jgi:glutathione S-transferase